MIEIKGTNINNIECYLISIRKKSFLFVSKPNLQNLRHFVNVAPADKVSHPTCKQKDESKIEVEEQQKVQQDRQSQFKKADFSQLKVHFDLTYLKQFFKTIASTLQQPLIYIMITHYQDFFILPYIMRKFKGKHEIKIFSTNIAYQMGRIYTKRLFQRVLEFDLLNSEPKGLSFDQESRLEDEFYVNFGIEIKEWTRIFKKQEMEECFKLANKMNYGQIYEADGVKFKPLASGHSLGSSLWMFENTLTKQTTMFIKQISTQTWRSIKQNRLFSSEKQTGFKQKDYQDVDLLIFANGSLVTEENSSPDAEILKLLKKILQNMQKSINTEVVLQDQLLILDIIDFISFEMKDKFRGIFVQNPEFNQIVSYANSYVQFLSPQYKHKIYQDPPQYPFESYLLLRQKGFLAAGSLYQICQRQKVPLKQLMRKSTPYIHFKSDFEAYLSELKDETINVYKQKAYLSPPDLSQLLTNINPKKIVSFTNILPFLDQKWAQNTGILSYSKTFVINSQPYNHYTSKNISPNIINKYEFVEGFLMAYPVNREFLRLGSTWKEELGHYLKQEYRPVLEVGENGVRTKSTDVWVDGYEIFVRSKDLVEVQFVLNVISRITKTLRLK